jgi:hypothetical protein
MRSPLSLSRRRAGQHHLVDVAALARDQRVVGVHVERALRDHDVAAEPGVAVVREDRVGAVGDDVHRLVAVGRPGGRGGGAGGQAERQHPAGGGRAGMRSISGQAHSVL